MDTTVLRIIPLGGLGEIGKNMMAFQYGTDVIVVDTGLMFPENDMLGIDYIIPDFHYLVQAEGLNLRGIIVTHGHEDHTGAIQHVVSALPAPIYATPLTRGLLEVKLKQARLLDQVEMVTFRAGDTLELGPFAVETFHVCHSIPDGVGLGINTPVGLIVHSGDFKFDHTPVDQWPPDFAKLADFASRGVLALLSDSTNADRPGWTPSEAVIDEAFDRVFRSAPGRIIVATFASLISRIQQVAWAAQHHNRKMAIVGHTMSDNVKMAVNLGYLELPPDLMISVDEANKRNPREVVIMTTGTQGEPSAGLSRLAMGQHNLLSIQPNDTVIMSSHPIPGNEEGVHRIINRLFQRGAQVIYDPIAAVHVSGHASQEEQKLLINLVRPKYFIPVHGELRHLKQHALLAEQIGIPRENIAVVENGTILEFDADSKLSIGDRVPGGYVFVDGARVGDVGPAVMRDREVLGRDGFVLVNVRINAETRQVLGEPEIISRGFVFWRESDELMDSARQAVRRAILQNPTANGRTQEIVQEALSKLFYAETKRRPMVFAFINEV
ncbi:MAG: ribonuclease J [Anaerolineae bacterium]|nr:ribonuclease J [Anaerolineae bacterium]